MTSPNPYAPPRDPAVAIAAPMPPPDPMHRHIQLALSVMMVLWHGLFVLSAVMNIVVTIGATGFWQRDTGNIVGTLIGFGVALLYGAGGVGWCIANIYGSASERPWTYGSLRAYWIASLLTVCCFPMGIVGLLHITRAHTKSAFGQGPQFPPPWPPGAVPGS